MTVTASQFNVPFEALLDRTAYLKAAVDALGYDETDLVARRACELTIIDTTEANQWVWNPSSLCLGALVGNSTDCGYVEFQVPPFQGTIVGCGFRLSALAAYAGSYPTASGPTVALYAADGSASPTLVDSYTEAAPASKAEYDTSRDVVLTLGTPRAADYTEGLIVRITPSPSHATSEFSERIVGPVYALISAI